jgi:hypothetical protein
VEVLGPLGLTRTGAALEGERHGRAVRIDFTAKGSITRVGGRGASPELADGDVLGYAGRGDASTWDGVRVESSDDRVTVRRDGNHGAAWLWDLWLAERLVAE